MVLVDSGSDLPLVVVHVVFAPRASECSPPALVLKVTIDSRVVHEAVDDARGEGPVGLLDCPLDGLSDLVCAAHQGLQVSDRVGS